MTYLLSYIQGNQKYYSSIMSLEIILKNSKVLVYGEDDYGYQRALVPSHYKKITKQLLDNENTLVSPTAIILGIDEEELNNYIARTDKDEIYTLNLETSGDNKLFRIVDGQHRLKGMEEALKENQNLSKYMLNVIIMVLKNNERKKEVEVFSNINSKAKKLKTDLTTLATYKYDLMNKEIDDSNIEKFLLTTVCKKINDDEIKVENIKNVWKNGIKLGVNEKEGLGIVSLNTFTKSMKKFINTEKKSKILELKSNKNNIFEEVDKYANEIATKIIRYWDIVYQEWPECFEYKSISYDSEGEEEIYYSNEYYLQKTMGTLVINEIISEISSEEKFKEKIKESELRSKDWRIGGKFTGLSSMSGKKYISSLF